VTGFNICLGESGPFDPTARSACLRCVTCIQVNLSHSRSLNITVSLGATKPLPQWLHRVLDNSSLFSVGAGSKSGHIHLWANAIGDDNHRSYHHALYAFLGNISCYQYPALLECLRGASLRPSLANSFIRGLLIRSP
jgi:hypothetical protein